MPKPRKTAKVYSSKSFLNNFQAKKEDLGKNALIITLWQEGFTLSTNPDDLRVYSEPRNAKFMAELKQGVVPSELRDNSNVKGMSVSLEDRRGDSFHRNQKQKPPSYFGGQGISLGGDQAKPVEVTISDKIQKISMDFFFQKFLY